MPSCSFLPNLALKLNITQALASCMCHLCATDITSHFGFDWQIHVITLGLIHHGSPTPNPQARNPLSGLEPLGIELWKWWASSRRMCPPLLQMELHMHAYTLTHYCGISPSPRPHSGPQHQKGGELCHKLWKISHSEQRAFPF